MLSPANGRERTCALRRQPGAIMWHDVDGVVTDDADIGEIRPISAATHPRCVHIDRQKIILRALRRDGRGRLAHAEADLQYLGIRAPECALEVERSRRVGDAEAR